MSTNSTRLHEVSPPARSGFANPMPWLLWAAIAVAAAACGDFGSGQFYRHTPPLGAPPSEARSVLYFMNRGTAGAVSAGMTALLIMGLGLFTIAFTQCIRQLSEGNERFLRSSLAVFWAGTASAIVLGLARLAFTAIGLQAAGEAQSDANGSTTMVQALRNHESAAHTAVRGLDVTNALIVLAVGLILLSVVYLMTSRPLLNPYARAAYVLGTLILIVGFTAHFGSLVFGAWLFLTGYWVSEAVEPSESTVGDGH